MQEGWERRHEHVTLSRETLSEMLRPVFPGGRIVTAEPLTGGLVNTNYRVVLFGRDEPVVVRVYIRDPGACQSERDIAALVGTRIRVPEVLYADCAAERPYMVTRWVEGVKLEALLARGDEAAIASAAHATGAVLAAIHTYAFPQAGSFGPGLSITEPFASPEAFFLPYIEETLFAPVTVQRLGDALTQRVWSLIQANLSLLGEAGDATALIHGDYKAQNLLLREDAGGEWAMAAVLDWEFAFAGMPLFDLGILLRYADALPPAYQAGILAGYRASGGVLPLAWKRITKLLDLMNLCGFLSLPEPRATMMAEVTGLVRETVERWQEYRTVV